MAVKTLSNKPGREQVGRKCKLNYPVKTVAGKRFKPGDDFTITAFRQGLYNLRDDKGNQIAHVRPTKVTLVAVKA